MIARARHGALLPAALAAMVLIGIAASAALYMARQERTASTGAVLQTAVIASADEAEALAVASMAAHASRLGIGQRSGTSIPVSTGGVRATASLTRLASTVFHLAVAARIEDAGGRIAQRTSSLLLRLRPAALELPAALTLTTAAEAAAGIAEGTDRGPDGWDCAADSALPAVLHPFTAPADSLEVQRLRERAAVRLSAGAATVIPAPVARGSECDTEAHGNWGDPGRPSACAHWLPVVHAPGDLRLPGGAGQGVLLVDGDLEVTGDFSFVGAIIVAGRLTVGPGAPQFLGGVRAAEIVDAGASRPAVTRSSCALRAAVLSAGTIAPLTERAWAAER